MTEFNISNIPPSTLTGLITTTVPGGIKLRWDTSGVDESLWGTQIWVSPTNNRDDAVHAVTERGSSYLYTTDPNNIRYFWIRAVSLTGFDNGVWEPVSPTGGVQGVSFGGTLDPYVFTPVSFIEDPAPTIAVMDETYYLGYLEWVAPPTGIVTAYQTAHHTSYDPVMTTDGDELQVFYNYYLYNLTDDYIVEGLSFLQVGCIWRRIAGINTLIVPDQIVHHAKTFSSDILGETLRGKTYRWLIGITKTQTIGTGGDLTVVVDFSYRNAYQGGVFV